MSMTRYPRTRVPTLPFCVLALPLFALPLFACGDNLGSSEPVCGNGIVEADEACDDGGDSPSCNANCTAPVCGDGITNAFAGEECDTAGETANCDADCTAVVCGDGIVNTAAGEPCDGDGQGNGGVSAGCNLDCTPALCGDGIVNTAAGEECDGDGAGVGGETAECNDDCTFSYCGDAIINVAAGEVCDTSNTGGARCTDMIPYDNGVLGCSATCDAFDFTTCGNCGDGIIGGSEECDELDFGTTTCGDFPPYDNGNLGCNFNCTIDTSSCGECGNGVVDGSEDCENGNVGNATCADVPPNTGGTLSCDDATCTFDTSACFSIEILQNDDGSCTQAIGCSSPDGSSGNPNEIVECFNSGTLPTPFVLQEIYYEVGADVPQPDELFVEVYEWTGVGLPGIIVDSIQLGPGDLSPGPHQVVLPTPLTVTTPDFCVGVNGYATTDGYRLQKSTTATVPNASFIRATSCGADDYTPMGDIGFPGNWCIRPTLSGAVP